ncbi:hypothetical protein FO519_003323 [Halicephalobus sp. NKZ332]|nr:hypothetical protein FO519_003323 [Halicephalobus sp. NKZ332]
MDEGAHPRSNNKPNGNVRNSNNSGGSQFSIQNEISTIKQELAQMRNAVTLLEQEKDSLRKAIRKLKLENEHMKKKYKSIQVKLGDGQDDDSSAEIEQDYDEIGRDFILVGGVHDPFSLRFEATLTDANGLEHKSAERFFWFKMAEFFNDTEAMKAIREAPNFQSAEDAMRDIKDFKEDAWNEVRLKFWEEGQRLKFIQNKNILNLLIHSGKTYIAVASQDKFFGTGWRKTREEANKPIYWDGENQGGKTLMRLRKELKQGHSSNDDEEEETKRKYSDLRRFIWRRIDPAKRQTNGFRGRRGSRVIYGNSGR